MKSPIRTTCIIVLLCYACSATAQVPVLSSNPSASATLFLDFDGHTVTGTAWNGTDALYCAPSGLTDAQITEIFDRVAEDYRPFNLNITTDSTKFLAAPLTQRTRVIVSVTNDWYQGVGGISFIGSFTWGDDTPCFVFSAALKYKTKWIAEAVAHEAGHTLGLYHQAVYDQNCNLVSGYNTGTGAGEIGWAPIMGVGYYQNMTLWNNGPNPYGCNQTQNDLTVITKYNGFGFRADDHGNTFAGATNTFFTNNQVNAAGVIEQNTDQDMFKFTIPVQGEFTLNAIPYNVGTNNAGSDIDMQVTLYNSSQTPINVYNPVSTLSLGIDTTLDAGVYYAKIEGIGNQFAPDYASLGSYSIQANFIDQSTPLPLRQLELKGMTSGEKHELSWLIDADEKVISQTIEVSTNGKDFTALNNLAVDARSYSYTPSTPETLLYRVNVTFDNNKTYISNIVSLRLSATVTARPQLNGNIITDRYLKVNSPGSYLYHVTDLEGKTIVKGQIANGFNNVNTTVIAGGLYLISFTNGKEQWTEKFVKQ